MESKTCIVTLNEQNLVYLVKMSVSDSPRVAGGVHEGTQHWTMQAAQCNRVLCMAGEVARWAQILIPLPKIFFRKNLRGRGLVPRWKIKKKNSSLTSWKGKLNGRVFFVFHGGLYIYFPSVFPHFYPLKTKHQIKTQLL